MTVDGNYVGVIYDCVNKFGGVTSEEEYGADASLTVQITCDLVVTEQLQTKLNDATRGSIEFSKTIKKKKIE